ncbi:MAG TPA: two-component regulator propeller domain-containing protein, partial [Rhodothermales bacterium]|nr:two-component regulator propeller domain-containing protein [Rhodothermales bacterium]
GGPDRPDVKSVDVDEAGDLWMGGMGSGLCRGRPGESPACEAVVGGIPGGYVNATMLAPGGTRYVAAHHDGLWCLPPGARQAATCPGVGPLPLVRDVLVGRDSTLWVSSGREGLFRYGWRAPAVVRVVTMGDTLHPYAWPLLEDEQGMLWLGTMGGGLFRVEPRTGRAQQFMPRSEDPQSLPGVRVVSLAQTPDGALWAGTMHNGLARRDPHTGRFRRFGEADGLPARAIPSLVVDRAGRLWAFTVAGVSRYERATGRFTTYGLREGFPPVVPYFDAAARDADGRLYVGTNGGLVTFHPDRVGPLRVPPRVWISEVRVNGTALDTNAAYLGGLRLPHHRNVLSFTVAAADPGPERPWTYAYRVGDGAWTDIGRRTSFDLGALPPGTHVLRIRAVSPTQTGPARTFRVEIRPPFWATWWFRGLAVLGLIGAVYGMHRVRVRSLLRVEHTRRRIADDLHDDLGTKLSTLATQLELSGHYSPPETTPGALVRFSEETRRLVSDLRDTVWVIDGQRDTLRSLADRIETAAFNLLGSERFRVERPATLPEVPLPMEQRRHVFLLLKEALHNAHRHADGAPIRLVIEATPEAAAFTVSDAGPGFDPNTLSGHGRGLATLARRAQAAGVRLELKTAFGAGTSVRVELPLKARRWRQRGRR